MASYSQQSRYEPRKLKTHPSCLQENEIQTSGAIMVLKQAEAVFVTELLSDLNLTLEEMKPPW